MLTLSYKNFRGFLRAIPICPKPKAIGLENIPQNEPILFVYNHVTRRAEPLFLGMAAPARPYVRFFGEITLVSTYKLSRTKRDIMNSIFSEAAQEKADRKARARRRLEKFVDFLTRFFIAQMSRFHIIPVYLHDPPTREEEKKKWSINKSALEECLKSLESHIPVAIAPSGGNTHETGGIPLPQTIVPTLASMMYKRGKIVKIVPSVVKEKPEVCKATYKKYLADRILPYRLFCRLINTFKGKRYERPRLTVEFLPPLTFTKTSPQKVEKVRFVEELQQIMYAALKKED
jgi:1-acyl-sn-glycerol-3-phosphate acyltransferase